MAAELPAYPWSSYHANALGATDVVVTPHERFQALGRTPSERRSAYRGLFREELAPDILASIRLATTKGRRLNANSQHHDCVDP
jgi:putative transposase